MDGDTGNLFHPYVDNDGDGDKRENLVRNKRKGQDEKTRNIISRIAKEDKNIYNTDIIYVSPKFQVKSDVKLPEKIARVKKKRIRKSSVDFKILKNKLSAYSVISKCLLKQKFPSLNHTSALNIRELYSGYFYSKSKNDVKVLYERETAQRGRTKHVHLKDSEPRAAKKSQSSDLFGFQRCMQRKRNVHYNLNVIYKCLRKHGKLKDHNVLRCKHYSFEDVNQNKCKKISSVVRLESDIPSHYNLVDFTQCSSVSNIYLLKPKDVNKGVQIKKNCKHKSSMKDIKRRCILNKSDSHDSANTQTSKIKRKRKKKSTCSCPTSKLFSLRTIAVNICQPSRWFCRHLTKPGLKSNVSDEHKESDKQSSEPLNVFRATFKYILCAIAVIIWLPCILVMGLLWLISYPLRPHQDPKYTETFRKKNKRNNTKLSKILCKCKINKRKIRNNKLKRKRRGLLSANKLQRKSSKLSRKMISQNAKRKYSKIYGKRSKKPADNTKKSLKNVGKNKKASRKSNTGFRLSDRTIKVTAFPSEVSRRSLDKKKQKNVTFKQPIENAYDKTMNKKPQKKQCLCSESNLSQNLKDDKCRKLLLKEIKRKKKKLRSYKIDPNECQEIMLKKHRTAKSKKRKITACVPKTLSKLLQTVLRHTYSKSNQITNLHKLPKVKNCYNTDTVPECVELINSQNVNSTKKSKGRRKKCKSYCCKKGCSGAQLPKSSNQNVLSQKSSTMHKERSKKNVKVATKKSTSVVKFFPPPKQQIQQPAPVIKYLPPPNQQTHSNTVSINEDPKKDSIHSNTKTIHQAPKEMKSDTPTSNKKFTKKGSKGRPTTVVKFFPLPCPSKDQSETNRMEGPLPKSSSKTKGLATPQLPAHTTSTNTDPAKPSSPRKFFSVPRKKSQSKFSNTSIPKTSSDNNFVKSFRRNTSSKGSATYPHTPTSVLKFIPAHCPQQCSASSNTCPQKTSSSFSESPKTKTVVKFFPPPQQRQINTAINNTDSKSSPLKSFLNGLRCAARTRSIGSDARLEKRTSVFKYLPPPRHDTRTSAVNAVKTPSVLSNVSTQSRPKDKILGDRFQRQPTSNKILLKSSQNYQKTSSSNMDPYKSPQKSSFSPPPSSLSKKRSRGVTTKRPSQVVKFFPKQQYNTRSFAVNARPSDKSNERIRTANKPICTPKGNISVIKFYPHPHIVTETIGTNTFLRTLDKKCDASKLTNIIKFYPSPKKTTVHRGTAPQKFKDQNLEKLLKMPPGTKVQGARDVSEQSDAQPCFIRGLRKLTDRQIIRKLGQPPQASNVSKPSSDATTLAGGKVKQKSKLVQSPCQPDCKGIQVNRKNYFDKKYQVAFTKRQQVQQRSDKPRGREIKAPLTTRRDPTVHRGSYGTKYSKSPAPGSAKPDESEKPPPGKIKKFLSNLYRDDEIDCTDLMMKSNERPCRYIYEHWPSAYPAFMVLYKIYNNMIHIFFFFFAACIWCPLFCWCFIFYFFVVKRLFC